MILILQPISIGERKKHDLQRRQQRRHNDKRSKEYIKALLGKA